VSAIARIHSGARAGIKEKRSEERRVGREGKKKQKEEEQIPEEQKKKEPEYICLSNNSLNNRAKQLSDIINNPTAETPNQYEINFSEENLKKVIEIYNVTKNDLKDNIKNYNELIPYIEKLKNEKSSSTGGKTKKSRKSKKSKKSNKKSKKSSKKSKKSTKKSKK